MDETTKRQKIARFLSDPHMREAVRSVLLDTFLQKRSAQEQDVHLLAADKIAVDRLNDGWKELEKYKEAVKDETERTSNPGL